MSSLIKYSFGYRLHFIKWHIIFELYNIFGLAFVSSACETFSIFQFFCCRFWFCFSDFASQSKSWKRQQAGGKRSQLKQQMFRGVTAGGRFLTRRQLTFEQPHIKPPMCRCEQRWSTWVRSPLRHSPFHRYRSSEPESQTWLRWRWETGDPRSRGGWGGWRLLAERSCCILEEEKDIYESQKPEMHFNDGLCVH